MNNQSTKVVTGPNTRWSFVQEELNLVNTDFDVFKEEK